MSESVLADARRLAANAPPLSPSTVAKVAALIRHGSLPLTQSELRAGRMADNQRRAAIRARHMQERAADDAELRDAVTRFMEGASS